MKRLLLVVALAVGLLGLLAAPALATTVPSPLRFYQSAPRGWQRLPVGTLLKWEYEPDSYSALDGLKGYRVMFVSTGALGNKVFETGMVYLPRAGRAPASGRPVVVWAHGTVGVGDSAAPSRYPWLCPDPAPTYDLYAQWVGAVGRMGYVVACPDYEGLGTPGLHPYLHAASEGYASIDSVRAARQLALLRGVRTSNRWAVGGHSQGGQAALAAADMASTYGRGLCLKASIAIAPTNNLATLAVGGQYSPIVYPYAGYLAWGVRAIDPTFDFASFCGAWILPVIDQAPDNYFDQWWGLVWAAHLDADGNLLTPGPGDTFAPGWDQTAGWQAFLRAADVEHVKASSPILVIQGMSDETGLSGTLQDLVDDLTAPGNDLSVVRIDGAGHDAAVILGLPATQDFLSAKLPVN